MVSKNTQLPAPVGILQSEGSFGTINHELVINNDRIIPSLYYVNEINKILTILCRITLPPVCCCISHFDNHVVVVAVVCRNLGFDEAKLYSFVPLLIFTPAGRTICFGITKMKQPNMQYDKLFDVHKLDVYLYPDSMVLCMPPLVWG